MSQSWWQRSCVHRGFEVLTTRDYDQLGQSDRDQLYCSATGGRVLLTHNRVDFEGIHREWLEAGKPHAGIIIARRRTPAEIAARVGRLITRLTRNELKNQLFYV